MDRLGNAILVTHEKNKYMHSNLLTFSKTVHQIGEGRNLNVSSKDRKGGTKRFRSDTEENLPG